MKDAIALIKDMEMEIQMAKKGVLSNFYLVDQGKMLDSLRQLRDQLPNEVKLAQNMLIEKQRILDEAKKQAENMRLESEGKARRILADATEEAHRLSSEAETRAVARVQAAKEQASAIEQDAAQRAAQMVAQEEIMQRAQVESAQLRENAQRMSEQMLEKANQQANSIYYNALDQADAMLLNMEKALDAQAGELRRLRAEMSQPQGTAYRDDLPPY